MWKSKKNKINCKFLLTNLVLRYYNKYCSTNKYLCRYGGTGRRTGLKILRTNNPSRFDSGYLHHKNTKFWKFKLGILIFLVKVLMLSSFQNKNWLSELCRNKERIKYIVYKNDEIIAKSIAFRKKLKYNNSILFQRKTLRKEVSILSSFDLIWRLIVLLLLSNSKDDEIQNSQD